MTKTLGELIASGDFTGYRSFDASWLLDAHKIEDLLYKRDYGGWTLADQHERAFNEGERIIAVEISTWLCTDTQVGLYVLVLNGTPIALSWQVARKSDREVALLNQAAHDLLAERWEAYRPAAERVDDFIDEKSLSLPVAGPGDEPLAIDESSQVYNLRLAVHGIGSWLKLIEPEGGIAAVNNRATLEGCRESAQADIDVHQGVIDNLAQADPEKIAENQEWVDEELEKMRRRIETVRELVIEPIDLRLAELDQAQA